MRTLEARRLALDMAREIDHDGSLGLVEHIPHKPLGSTRSLSLMESVICDDVLQLPFTTAYLLLRDAATTLAGQASTVAVQATLATIANRANDMAFVAMHARSGVAASLLFFEKNGTVICANKKKPEGLKQLMELVGRLKGTELDDMLREMKDVLSDD